MKPVHRATTIEGQSGVTGDGNLTKPDLSEESLLTKVNLLAASPSEDSKDITKPAVKYLKRFGTPDWDYYISNPILEVMAKRDKDLHPYDPVSKKFISPTDELMPEFPPQETPTPNDELEKEV